MTSKVGQHGEVANHGEIYDEKHMIAEKCTQKDKQRDTEQHHSMCQCVFVIWTYNTCH